MASLFASLCGFVAAVSLLNFAAPARAQTYWQSLSSTDDWSTSADWSNGLPTSSATAYITDGGTANITTAGDACNTLSLGGTAGSGAINMTGGALSANNTYVGFSGTGAFAQSGGTNEISNNGSLYVGYNSGSSGTYNLSGGSASAANEFVGWSGTGAFTQSGGTNAAGYLYLAGAAGGGNGTYSLNAGYLTAGSVSVGFTGTGVFNQSAGTNAIAGPLILGWNGWCNGTYSLSGGSLNANSTDVGFNGTGVFTQSGGTSKTGGTLYVGDDTGSSGVYTQSGGVSATGGTLQIGYYSGSTGLYTLSGTGALSAGGGVSVGYGYGGVGRLEWLSSASTLTTPSLTLSPNGTLVMGFNFDMAALASGALFNGTTFNAASGSLEIAYGATATQTSGAATVGTLRLGTTEGSGTYSLSGTGELSAACVSIGSGGCCLFSGGTLQTIGLASQGVFNGGNSPALLADNGILNLSSGTWTNLGATSLGMGANSLLIVPAVSSPLAEFASVNCRGLTHTAGTTLSLSAGQGFGGCGSISDSVSCQGTITAASSGFINLSNGLVLAGAGVVNLGNGALTVNDPASAITGGSLAASYQYVGCSGTGTFTQSGGTNTSINSLYLGYRAGDNGTYNLSGVGLLNGNSEYVGYCGAGGFMQSGGTNEISNNALYVGYNPGSSGAYSLSGTAGLSVFLYYGPAAGEYIGYSGSGAFTQSGGWNADQGPLSVGYNSGSSGTYSLSGTGLLITFWDPEYVGYSGTGAFTQSGGTNAAGYPCLGYNFGSSGTYNLSGGSLNASSTDVGYSGTGVFTQSGGTDAISGNLCLGYNSGASGTYNLNGGILSVGSLSQGSGAAAFNFGGGTLQAAGPLTTAVSMTLTGSGGNATVNTNGYAMTLAGNLSGPGGLTKTGSGTLTLAATGTYSGGTVVNQGNLVFSSTSAIPSSGSVQINAAGAVNISGAYTTASSWLASGKINANSTGALALTRSSNENINFAGYNTLSLGATGTQTYTGTITPASSGYNLGGGGGTLLYNGPALTGSNSLTINGNVTFSAAQSYSGPTTISAGTLETTGGNNRLPTTTTLTIGPSGVLDLEGNDQTVGGLSGSAGAIVANNSSATNTSTLTVSESPGSTTFAGNIIGNNALALSGSGELTLSGTDTYSGGTTISGGTLDIAAASALPSTGLVTISGGGRLVLGSGAGIGALLAASSPIAAAHVALSAAATPGAMLGATPAAVEDNAPPQCGAENAVGAAAAVPEPQTIALLIAAAVCGLAMRRADRLCRVGRAQRAPPKS